MRGVFHSHMIVRRLQKYAPAGKFLPGVENVPKSGNEDKQGGFLMNEFIQKVRYRFDNLMSRGTTALIGWLFALSLLLILGIASIMFLSGITPDPARKIPFWEYAWMTFLHAIDSGAMSGESGNTPYFSVIVFATFAGLFLVSTLIGIINNGIGNKVEELRRGGAQVIEKNHTVILGWSPQIGTIISELVIANENHKNMCIAILADRDKVEMEQEIHSKIPDTKTTNIVCRTGNPIDIGDLGIVNVHDSRSIIILSPETDNPDAQTIKVILAITNHPNRRQGKYHIVAELREERNLEVARLVGKDEVELIIADDLIAKIISQTCRQSGLSVVYTDLMDFEGDEIYFARVPELAGKSFREALFAFRESSVIGIFCEYGSLVMQPQAATTVNPGDQLIVISRDDDSVLTTRDAINQFDESVIRAHREPNGRPETTLILGWNRRAPKIIRELDRYVADSSTITVVTDEPKVEEYLQNAGRELVHGTVRSLSLDITRRSVLDSLQCEQYDHIILLSNSDYLGIQEADAGTLITLLHLRDIGERLQKHLHIVSEMMDIRNRELADVTKADDFIVSDKLDSLMLAQISENKHLARVFNDLFDANGSEIYLKPVEDYVATGVELNFYTVLEAALRLNEIAFGYRRFAFSEDVTKGYGVVVNPVKDSRIVFERSDKIIVLAES
jgi:ion channel POLLUX/CASTOR